MNQYWFSLAKLPIVTPEQSQDLCDLFSNCYYPIGNIVDGRMLCRVLADDFESIKTILDGIGKEVILCGGHDAQGYWIEGLERNDTEFEKYMQPTTSTFDGVEYMVTPADNTSGGRPEYRNGTATERESKSKTNAD